MTSICAPLPAILLFRSNVLLTTRLFFSRIPLLWTPWRRQSAAGSKTSKHSARKRLGTRVTLKLRKIRKAAVAKTNSPTPRKNESVKNSLRATKSAMPLAAMTNHQTTNQRTKSQKTKSRPNRSDAAGVSCGFRAEATTVAVPLSANCAPLAASGWSDFVYCFSLAFLFGFGS
eukprot:SAG31_NODE_309_length_17949_cov_11.083361_5_plen_173_part_00